MPDVRGRNYNALRPPPTTNTEELVRRNTASIRQSAVAIDRAQAALYSAQTQEEFARANAEYQAADREYIRAVSENLELGYDVDGQPIPEDADGSGASLAIAQGNLSARFAELAEQRRRNDILHQEFLAEQDRLREVAVQQGEEERARLEEQQRGTNINGVLDTLANEIRRGELTSQEARDRAAAAFDAAQIQRGVLADHAGKNLPAGTKHFPNLGPGGLIANAAAALGFPFTPVETMGTFEIDPNAMAAPISQAYNQGPSGSMQADAALAAAARALAGLGVPA